MNYCSKIWVILFFIIVLSSRLILAQEETPEQVRASLSKTVEKPAPTNSPMVYGPISIKLVNEPVISAIKKVAVAVRLRPVLDYDLIKKDKKVNLTLELASLPEALDQILQDMEIQYSITESGLLVFTEKHETHAEGSGTLKGSVLDKANREPLIGANVVIQKTSLGVAADVDGNFQIKLIPVGTWNVKVSCVGYVPIVREVTIKENETAEEDFSLTAQAIMGEEVVVTAQARGQVQAINQQLSSDKIVSIVSEARIQELPDFNAAQAISRLPGVSTIESSGEASKVVVRGISPQMNQVSIGGISIASTGSTQIGASSELVTSSTGNTINNDRSVDLTMVTPYMIKSIEVFKSLTPDLNANAIGGIVNMNLREAPSGLHGDAMWQSGYTAKTGNYGNYRTVVSMSDRFFDNSVGIYVLGNAEQYDRDDDHMDATYQNMGLVLEPNGYKPVMVTTVALQKHMETRNRYGANLVLDYKYSNGVLRGIVMYSRMKSDFINNTETIDYKQGNITFQYQSGKSTTDVGVNTLELEHDFGFMSLEMKGGNTYSINGLPRSPLYRVFQTGGVPTSSSAQYDIPPEGLVSRPTFKGDSLIYLSSMNLLSSLYQERDVFLKGDFKIPYSAGNNISGHLKFGGEYRKNVHTNDQSTPYFRPFGSIDPNVNPAQNTVRRITNALQQQFGLTLAGNGQYRGSWFTSHDSKMYDSFLGNNFGQFYYAIDGSLLNTMIDFIRSDTSFNAYKSSPSAPGGWTDDYYAELANDYDYTENYGAGYLMTQLNVGSVLTIIGGARYEEITSRFHAYNLVDRRNAQVQDYKEVVSTPSNHFLLPMIQAKYNLFDWSDIRYSYSQTLARPDYSQLSPHYTISQYSKQIWAGNPNLRPMQSTNHDLMLTFHSNELGLFSVGAFYKEIKDFSYSTSYKLRDHPIGAGQDSLGSFSDQVNLAGGDFTLYTYVNNPSLSYIRGVEFDLQTRFWYLPFPFDGLLLGLNYTHITSETTYPYRDEYTTGKPPHQTTVIVDSTRAGRMLNQPNDIANIFVGYDYKGFSAKVTLAYQGNSVSYIGAFPEYDGFTADYFRVDLSIRQTLPWSGLQIFLDITNLNNRQNISRQVSIDGFTNQKNYGLQANLGVRYIYAFD